MSLFTVYYIGVDVTVKGLKYVFFSLVRKRSRVQILSLALFNPPNSIHLFYCKMNGFLIPRIKNI